MAMYRHISPEGLALIKQFEGCRLQAYKALPTERYYTIGYGHYSANITSNMVITQQEADNLLLSDLRRFEENVNKYYPHYLWKQNEYDALVSFAFNIGNIDQLTAHGSRNREMIANKMLEYCKSGGKVIDGLVNRRIIEKALFTRLGS